eukprot:gene56741-75768_t
MTRLVGFYPGSFDPLTNGHLDVIERACKIVDTLVVAVGVNPSKKPLFSHADRIELLRQTLEPVGERTATEFKIVEFTGLMVNAARATGRVVQVGTHRRISPHNVSGRDFIRAGKIGDIGMVRCFVNYGGSGPEKPLPTVEVPK